MFTLSLLALASLFIGTGAIYMALLQPFPLSWLYYHYFLRKPVAWGIVLVAVLLVGTETLQSGTFELSAIPPLLFILLGLVLTYRMHQEVVFCAQDFPPMADDPLALPLQDDMQLAVIEYEGEVKAYPLDFVVHHHIINDHFGEKTVALTYCAMCRSVIPFDVTDIGPLFVGSFKDANMIVADRRTKTFFQQATFESVIGKLHPHTLEMLPFQILEWRDVKELTPLPQVCQVTEKDFRQFELPIPGVWKKLMAGEATPGMRAQDRDKKFKARTRVIGITDKLAFPQVVYLKSELLSRGLTKNEALNVVLVARGDTINAFLAEVNGQALTLSLNPDGTLCDQSSQTVWNALGHHQEGPLRSPLTRVAISDEYWFSWKAFHPRSELIRLD